MTSDRFENLLSPGRIGRLETRNRIVMSPMGSNLSEPDGRVGERLLAYYEERAKGGVGLVTVGVAAISYPDGACNPNQVAISGDAFLPGLSELARRVHRHGARAAVQLQHAGKVAVRDMVAGRPMWVPSVPELKVGDLTRDLTPDEMDRFTRDFRRPGAGIAYHEMTPDDVATLVARFAEAAVRAREAGFDGVELHAGHGYILSSFLSPASNRRDDAYGGPLENRARFLVETIRAARAATGGDFPVWCRLDACEYRTSGGIAFEDAARTAELAAAAGADAIHVSAYADSSVGAAFTEAPLVHAPCGYVPFARAIRRRVGVPVIAVGRIEPEEAEALVAEGGADFVAMARKLLADPELPRKLAAGRRADVRPCIYCYTCVGRIFLNQSSACAVNPRSGSEHEIAPEADAGGARKRVVVVGGGPAGLEAARVAALRGHDVTLVERAPVLGGALRLSTLVNADNAPLLAWLEAQVGGLPIDVRLGADLSAHEIAALGADVVLVATGAARPRPDVPGAGAPHVWGIEDAVDDAFALRDPGRDVVVLGGSGPGLAFAASYLSRTRVTVLEPGGTLGARLSPPRRWRTLAALREGGATLVSGATLERLDGGVCYAADGERHVARAETVLVAEGWRPDDALARDLEKRVARVVRLGDCREIGLIEGALAAAGEVARAL